MKYEIVDTDTGDYLQPYDEDRQYWTLDEAKDLAYRRQEEWCELDDPEYYEDNVRYLREIEGMTDEKEIASALINFNYYLERSE